MEKSLHELDSILQVVGEQTRFRLESETDMGLPNVSKKARAQIWRVLFALQHAANGREFTTSDIAKLANLKTHKAYEACNQLERAGFVDVIRAPGKACIIKLSSKSKYFKQ